MDHEQHLRDIEVSLGFADLQIKQAIRWALAEIDRLSKLVTELEAELADTRLKE